MSEGAIIERRGAALFIINNNPAALNALTFDFSRKATAALQQAAEDKSIAAVVLTGAAGFFCAGGDLNVLIRRREMEVKDRIAAIEVLHGLIRAIRACPKPVIAAVEGGAAGAGAPIAMACDLIVASREAYFAISYLRVGLSPDGGSTAFLSENLPRQLINEILMFGDKMSTERLYQLGVINRLTDAGGAEVEAIALAERLYNVGPEALSRAKALVLAAGENEFGAQLDLEAVEMANAQSSEESGEGIRAFLEKRKPDFTRFRE